MKSPTGVHDDALFAKEGINGAGEFAGEKLALLIRPVVFGGAGDVDGARGSQRDEHMHVHRARGGVAGVARIIRREPVREGLGDDGGRFTKVPAHEGGSALAGVIGDDDAKAFILRASPEGSFAQT